MQISSSNTPAPIARPAQNAGPADRTGKVKAELQTALDNIKKGRIDLNAQSRSMAQERIAFIKELLKALRQFPGLDPKSATRMLAGLAGQLDDAVAQYAKAGGTMAPDTASPSPGAPKETPALRDYGFQAYARTQNAASGDKKRNDGAFLQEAGGVLSELKFMVQFQKIQLRSFEKGLLDPALASAREAEKAFSRTESSLSRLALSSSSLI